MRSTPGPWRAERFGAVTAVVGGARRQVALATGDAAMHGDKSVDPDVIRNCDARLIASAPELLALIQEVLRAGNANTRALKSAIEKASPGWCRSARAVIAKVDGENP